MSAGRRLSAIPIALILPPLGAWMVGSRQRSLLVNIALFLAANIVFWGFAALPGLVLYGLVVLHSIWLVLASTQGREAKA